MQILTLYNFVNFHWILLKFGIWNLYMIINGAPKYFFQYSENNFRFYGKNLNCYKDGHVEKVISLWTWFWPWGTLWWISIDIMICKWEFWFFDLLMAIFSLLECFATFHKLPILERSTAVRRACLFQDSENNFRFCGKNLNCCKDWHVEKSYFPLKLKFTMRDSLVNIYRYYDL